MTNEETLTEEETTEAETEPAAGEQLELIDVAPENAKPIIELAKQYKEVQTTRLAALKQETELKQKIITAVHEANLQRLDDGKIRFTYDNVTISIEPSDEKVKVKFNTDGFDDEE